VAISSEQVYQRKKVGWFQRIVGKSPQELRSLFQEGFLDNGDVHDDIWKTIEQCMDEDPEKRPTIYIVAKTIGETLGVEWDDGYHVLAEARNGY
jgi:hypothetical protein